MKNNLDARLLNFLSNAKVPSTKLLALESDASKRKYYRSKIKQKKILIMDSSYEKKSLKSFVKISDWLSKKGYSTPDIFYKDTTTISKSTLEIVFDAKRPLFNYAENIKHKYIKIDDYQILSDAYNNTNNDFLDWLENNDYQFDKDDIIKDWDYINNRIFAEVANKLFNRNLYYKSIINNDNVVKEALKYFEDANELLN